MTLLQFLTDKYKQLMAMGFSGNEIHIMCPAYAAKELHSMMYFKGCFISYTCPTDKCFIYISKWYEHPEPLSVNFKFPYPYNAL